MIRLAVANLLHNRARTFVGVAGVSFAVVLVFMQLGFLGALITTATVIYRALDFDVCIRSKDYLHLAQARTFPEARLHQLGSVAGIKRVSPLYIGISSWRNPPHSDKPGQRRSVMTMGVRQEDPVFQVRSIQNLIDNRLALPTAMLIDQQTRPEFGPVNGQRFGQEDVAAGATIKVGGQPMRIVGYFSLGTGFAANGAVLLNQSGFARVSPGRSSEQVSLGLVQLAPAADSQRVVEVLRQRLPEDVEVLSDKQAMDLEINYWVWRTSYGLLFVMGVAIALVVGAGIVYQVLAQDVAYLLHEYATLRAMGYHTRFLAGVVVVQAIALSAAGFVAGFLLSLLLYHATSSWAHIPIRMTLASACLVLLLSAAMCVVSGLAATRKLVAADPADLF